MKNSKEKQLKNTKGITLIALVITIIVLLILAGVSLSAVFNQDGIFSRAEQATDKYGRAKARETLELVLGEFQMTKYEEGLSGQTYENRLDSKIEEVGSLLPKEDENSNYQLVIVEGHIFEIDRSVPKIVDYKGPADGIIITAQVTQNGDWQNPVATVTGTITKYGGGSVVSSSATATNNVTIPSNFPTTGGSFTIPNITEDTDIIITAIADDGKPAVTKIIEVQLVRDTTPPTISEQEAILSEKTDILNGMKIRISAKAVDSESGLAGLEYEISPNTIKDNKAKGTLKLGIPIEIETTKSGNYTVTFTARDNVGNSSIATVGPVTTSDTILISDLKSKINASNYPEYLGMKVNYKLDDSVAWRVFYYDATGTEFGDGAKTIYLKRDYDVNKKTTLTDYYNMTSATSNGLKMMKKLNPDWASKDGVANLGNEKSVAGLCDTANWTSYCDTNVAKYAIGAAPAEMWTKAYNAYLRKYELSKVPSKIVNCGRQNEYGYGWGLNGGSLSSRQSLSIDTSIEQSIVIMPGATDEWLASTSSSDDGAICRLANSSIMSDSYWTSWAYRPVVCLKNN